MATLHERDFSFYATIFSKAAISSITSDFRDTLENEDFFNKKNHENQKHLFLLMFLKIKQKCEFV